MYNILCTLYSVITHYEIKDILDTGGPPIDETLENGLQS